MDNEATLSGVIASEPIFSHCIHETRLYTCEICVKRLSDTVDRIVLLAPEALCLNLTGEVTVHGQLRGYTRQDADKRRLILMVLIFVCVSIMNHFGENEDEEVMAKV